MEWFWGVGHSRHRICVWVFRWNCWQKKRVRKKDTEIPTGAHGPGLLSKDAIIRDETASLWFSSPLLARYFLETHKVVWGLMMIADRQRYNIFLRVEIQELMALSNYIFRRFLVHLSGISPGISSLVLSMGAWREEGRKWPRERGKNCMCSGDEILRFL